MTLVGAVLIGAAAASAFFAAVSLRLGSLVSTLLAAYLAFVANLGGVSLALSPFRAVTPEGLGIAEGLLLAAAMAGWWLRGRPGVPVSTARAAVREAISDPVVALFVLGVLLLLVYEGLLASSPPNNMDSLTYHLAKAAAWTQHGGYFWVPNSPEVEINMYQPFAEQQQLFLMTANGSGALYALPQFVAGLAAIVAVYGGARRLGFEVRAAVSAACLFATFSLVALEAVTGQVDLVAAALAGVAGCLLLAGGPVEAALAGAAVALGLGTKLTVGLVVPILALLALNRGRRTVAYAVAGGVVGFVAIGMWGYVINLVHTGHVLGVGTGPVQFRGSPAYPKSVANAFYLMYGLMDLSVLSDRFIEWLAVAGATVGLGVWWARRRWQRGSATATAASVALPFFAPLLVLGGAALVAFGAYVWGFPIRGHQGMLVGLDQDLNETYTRFVNEDYSAFGPLGIVALVASAFLATVAFAKRRVDARHAVIGTTLPLFLVLISLTSTWHVFLVRFFLLPAALAAPLLAHLLRSRAATAAYLVTAAVVSAMTITHDQPKPLNSPYRLGHPWNYNQVAALAENSTAYLGYALAAYNADVPPHACVGAILDTDEPSYLLYGARLQHRLYYLTVIDAVATAVKLKLSYVVITTGENGWIRDDFRSAGWRIRQLGGYWVLASRRSAVVPCN